MRAPVSAGALACILLLLLAAPLAAAPDDVSGWRAARWGMTAAELEAAFDGRLTRLPGRREYGGAYAELALLGVRVAGHRFDAYFQMGETSGRLQQVLLERARRWAGPRGFVELAEALRRRYGPPTRTCADAGDGGRPTAAEAVWRFPTTTVHAVLLDFYTSGMAFDDPNVDPDPLTPFYRTRRNNPRFLPRRLLLRLHPSDRPDLASPRCPAP